MKLFTEEVKKKNKKFLQHKFLAENFPISALRWKHSRLD